MNPLQFPGKDERSTTSPTTTSNTGFPHLYYGYAPTPGVTPTFVTTPHSQPRLRTDFIFLAAAGLYLISCIAAAIWMLIGGPKLVPHQDTRITNIVISFASRIGLGFSLWIVHLRLRTQWARILVSGRQIQLHKLLVACSGSSNLDLVRRLFASPTFGAALTVVLGLIVMVLTTLTSAGFKYIVLPGSGDQPFSSPDFIKMCDYSQVNSSTGYFCSGIANAAVVNTEWSIIDVVNSGAGGNIQRSSGRSGTMSANVTLTSAPADLRLPGNPAPPWAAVDVTCRPATLEMIPMGNGSTSSNIIVVDGRQIDQLSIAEMPTWASQVQLYQQVNDSGPASSLCPWYMVLLARDLDDGGANILGLSGSAVTFLGNTFLDLHGYGPVLQGVLGAAAYCSFDGSTGGIWPAITWPWRSTSNVVVGKQPSGGTVDISTVFLNYGPSWQYNPDSANNLPGGAVTYIANWTTPADTFSDFIAVYMRNQWTLMTYTNNFIDGFIVNTTYYVQTTPQLYIKATLVLLAPVAAYALIILCAAILVWSMIDLGSWYQRIDMAPWWLLKVTATGQLRTEIQSSSTKLEFNSLSERVECSYVVGTQNMVTDDRLVFGFPSGASYYA